MSGVNKCNEAKIRRVRGQRVVKAGILDGVTKEVFSEVTFEQRPEWSMGARQANA